MSTSWTTPDPRRTLAAGRPAPPAFGAPYDAVADAPSPPLRDDLLAGALTVLVTVLVGAPVGLLWAALAPKVPVSLADGGVNLIRPLADEFIAGDGYFLFAVALAGLVGGLVAWALGRRHGPAVVVGLFLGGLVAAYVAMVVGEQVGVAAVEQAAASGESQVVDLALRLRAGEAMVGWPVASLLAYLSASFAWRS